MCIPGSGKYQALLIPDDAIASDQDRRIVLTVGPENKVIPRRVTTGALFGRLRVIATGLSIEDRVIINGMMHSRPGTTVAPTEATPAVDESVFTTPGGIAATQPASSPAIHEALQPQPGQSEPKAGSRP